MGGDKKWSEFYKNIAFSSAETRAFTTSSNTSPEMAKAIF